METKKGNYYGKEVTLYKYYCVVCNIDIWYIKTKPRKYCSRLCESIKKAELARKKKAVVFCAICNSTLFRSKSKLGGSKSGLYFCTRQCKSKAQRVDSNIKELQPPHYGTGLSKYRVNAFKVYGKLCNKCGYKDVEKMLDVDHIDSDRTNNKIINLQVLCVWCHALKTRRINVETKIDLRAKSMIGEEVI